MVSPELLLFRLWEPKQSVPGSSPILVGDSSSTCTTVQKGADFIACRWQYNGKNPCWGESSMEAAWDIEQ